MLKTVFKYTEALIHLIFWIGIITIKIHGENTVLSMENQQLKVIEVNMKTMAVVAFLSSAVIFYINIIVLNRLFYRRKKYASFLALLIIFFLVFIGIEYFVLEKLLGPLASAVQQELLTNHFVFLLFSIIYIVAKDRLKIEVQKQQIVSQQLSHELDFLKAQLNPHFLFNCINNIYSTAVENSDQEVAKQIADLTQVLRYALYESHHTAVPLSDEINFLKGYIDLNLLKFENGELDFSFSQSGETKHLKIAPLLLVPIVENAFKHGISSTNKPYIYISLTTKHDSLQLEVKNAMANPYTDSNPKTGGVGLVNLRRRLDLLYPDNHLLEIDKNDEYFYIKLHLNSMTTNE